MVLIPHTFTLIQTTTPHIHVHVHVHVHAHCFLLAWCFVVLCYVLRFVMVCKEVLHTFIIVSLCALPVFLCSAPLVS
jgi:hypothetical protein